MNEIPDELIDQVLAEPKAREQIEALLKANNINEPLEDLPRETVKAAVGALLGAAQQAQNGPPPPEITDALVDQVLSDATALNNINGVLAGSDIKGGFEAQPREQQKAILTQIIAQQQAASGGVQSGGGIQVNLEALGVPKDKFDVIWSAAQEDAKGDVSRLVEVLRVKLTLAGAPAAAIESLISQFPKANGAA